MFEHLPFEQVSDIFSRLTRNDVLKCMRVSRRWYTRVPKYASECFHQVHLDSRRLNPACNRLLKRVGGHVRVVVLEGFTLYKENVSLIHTLCPKVNTLQLKYCGMDEHLGSYLAEISELLHLKVITPKGIPWSSEYILSILSFCRHMASISITGIAYPDTPANLPFPRSSQKLTHTHLQHLDASALDMSVIQLEDVLRYCPNLKSLVAMEEDDVIEEKAILIRYCPKLRHLYYRRRIMRYETQPMISYDGKEEEKEEDEELKTNGISLQSLEITDPVVQHFLEQRRIKHLRILRFGETKIITESIWTSIEQLVNQNTSTLQSVYLHFPLGNDRLHRLIQLLETMASLKSIHLSFHYKSPVPVDWLQEPTEFVTTDMVQKIGNMASMHPTLQSIGLSLSADVLDADFISAMTRIPHLKQTELCVVMTPEPGILQELFEQATDLERINLMVHSQLNITKNMFKALAKLRLHQLRLVSGNERSTMNTVGFRYFIDRHAGPLHAITISSKIKLDQESTCISYASQKWGDRLNYR
ncbi:hypothetical protein K492DRAFT_207081 [Lichtheimia hyalospora FSU 10163]|nr:hypothetical protein K492DRAFT_207081 [Lichtheimia hyalospora FSU 10163]